MPDAPAIRVITLDDNRDPVTTSYKKMSDVSDGYHTFGELYEMRALLQAGWFSALYADYNDHGEDGVSIKPVKSKLHSDGEKPFGKDDYFIVVAQLPTGQISNHYKMDLWDYFDIPEVDKAPEFDGHTAADITDRIKRYLKGEF